MKFADYWNGLSEWNFSLSGYSTSFWSVSNQAISTVKITNIVEVIRQFLMIRVVLTVVEKLLVLMVSCDWYIIKRNSWLPRYLAGDLWTPLNLCWAVFPIFPLANITTSLRDLSCPTGIRNLKNDGNSNRHMENGAGLWSQCYPL